MGYQALLFCADEKSAQLVTQVLTELEFSVEPANEPFAAVKRLTTQHFDAVVVDCENEQNASLLFKSARNSGPNKTSLAVAVVEGQPGIAKAFRIGANLVLTKPINVEQSKGTLRVARGLLKKPEAGKPAAAVATAPVAQAPAAPARPVPNNPAFARPTGLAVPTLKPVVPPKSITTKPAPPAVRAEAPSMLELEAEPIPQTESTDAALLASMPDPVVATPAPPSLTPKAAWPPSKTGNPFSGGSAASGQATGIAPARETAPRALEPKPAAFVPATSEPSRPVAHSHPADTYSSAPILSMPEPSGSGAQKWILIAAAIVLAAVGGYFVSTKMHPGSTAVPVATTPTQPAAAQPAPEQSAPAQDITLGGSSGASNTHPTTPAPATQVAPVNQTTPQEEVSDEDSAETLKKPAQKPSTANAEKSTLVVKSSASKLAQAQAEQAPQAIPMTGLASNSGDKALSGILEAGPSARTPVLRTVKVSQGVSQGLVIKKVSPDYPAQARQLRIEGSVQLEATISKDGSVKNLKVVSGHPILARSAMEAVKQWKYKPYLLNGQAVEIDTQIAVNFKLP